MESRFVEVEGIKIHYREAGTGAPVLLLHGFPTSSYLYRRVAPHIAAHNRVIVPDLPGYGASDKPLNASYSFRFYQRVLDQFVERLSLEHVGLTLHDIGGPIGLYWAMQKPQRITKLALLNTLVYPELSWAVIAFVLALRTPGLRWWLTSAAGLQWTFALGLADRRNLTPDVLEQIQTPFRTPDAQRALVKAGIGLHRDGFKDIAAQLSHFKMPVRLIYGQRDRILPDVAQTMRRLARDLPQAQVTALDCGHFLQEEQPESVGKLLAEFFAGA